MFVFEITIKMFKYGQEKYKFNIYFSAKKNKKKNVFTKMYGCRSLVRFGITIVYEIKLKKSAVL